MGQSSDLSLLQLDKAQLIIQTLQIPHENNLQIINQAKNTGFLDYRYVQMINIVKSYGNDAYLKESAIKTPIVDYKGKAFALMLYYQPSTYSGSTLVNKFYEFDKVNILDSKN